MARRAPASLLPFFFSLAQVVQLPPLPTSIPSRDYLVSMAPARNPSLFFSPPPHEHELRRRRSWPPPGDASHDHRLFSSSGTRASDSTWDGPGFFFFFSLFPDELFVPYVSFFFGSLGTAWFLDEPASASSGRADCYSFLTWVAWWDGAIPLPGSGREIRGAFSPPNGPDFPSVRRGRASRWTAFRLFFPSHAATCLLS